MIGYPRGEDQGGPGCTGSDAVLGAFRKEEACGGQGLHGHHPSPTIYITRSEMTLSLYCFEQRVQGRRRAPCVHVFRSDVIKVDEGCSWPNSIEFRCNAKPNHENITHETVNSAASAIVTELPSSTAHCAEGMWRYTGSLSAHHGGPNACLASSTARTPIPHWSLLIRFLP